MGDVDWRKRAETAEEELADARRELQDYQESSALLEKELENENKELEKKLKEERVKRQRLEQELDKVKERMSNTSDASKTQVTSMQNELVQLREENQKFSKTLREMEQRNDELEETARRATSFLDNIQAEINARIEENEFLKTEIEDRAANEQHLKEEIRDLQAALDVSNARLEKMKETSASASSHPDSEQLQIVQALLDEQVIITSGHAKRVQELEEELGRKTALVEELGRKLEEQAQALAQALGQVHLQQQQLQQQQQEPQPQSGAQQSHPASASRISGAVSVSVTHSSPQSASAAGSSPRPARYSRARSPIAGPGVLPGTPLAVGAHSVTVMGGDSGNYSNSHTVGGPHTPILSNGLTTTFVAAATPAASTPPSSLSAATSAAGASVGAGEPGAENGRSASPSMRAERSPSFGNRPAAARGSALTLVADLLRRVALLETKLTPRGSAGSGLSGLGSNATAAPPKTPTFTAL